MLYICLFFQFIDARLDILNNKNEPDDLFEEVIIKCESTAGVYLYLYLCGCACVCPFFSLLAYEIISLCRKR